MNKISERIKKIIDYKGISIRQFEQKIGTSNGVIAKIISKDTDLSSGWLSKIIENYSDIDANWLLTGEGEMLKGNDKPNAIHQSKDSNEGIPLIPINAMAGFSSGEMQILEYECERFVVPTFKDADFLIAVRGSSMYPKYNSGDIVACRKLPLDTFFQWNKVYVLDTSQGALIKRVAKSDKKEYILIVSDNEKYLPFDLHLSQINALAIVIGVIRLE